MLYLPDQDNKSENSFHVLFVTTQWPTDDFPYRAPFVKREVEILRESGLKVDVIVFEGGFNLFRYVRAVYDINRYIRQMPYDVIHARFGQSGLVAMWQNKIPLVVTYGGSDIEYTPDLPLWKNNLLHLCSKFVALRANSVLVVSDHLGKLLPIKNYNVLSSVVDTTRFRPMSKKACRDELGLPQDKKLILFAASDLNHKRKRYQLAVDIVKQLQQNIDVELVVLTGEPVSKVPIFMNACDALIMTSTHEGSPNVVKEALACNLPVISTDVGDVRERLAGLKACFVSADDSVKVMVEGALQVLTSKVAFDGQETVKDLNKANFTQRMREIYAKVIQAKTSNGGN